MKSLTKLIYVELFDTNFSILHVKLEVCLQCGGD